MHKEIKEIALNPKFSTEVDMQFLVYKGVSVRWMTEEEYDEAKFYTLIFEE